MSTSNRTASATGSAGTAKGRHVRRPTTPNKGGMVQLEPGTQGSSRAQTSPASNSTGAQALTATRIASPSSSRAIATRARKQAGTAAVRRKAIEEDVEQWVSKEQRRAENGGIDPVEAQEPPTAPIELLSEFLSCVMGRKYEQAKELCNQILAFEPQNETARQFLSTLNEKIELDEADEEQTSSEDSEEDDSDEETADEENQPDDDLNPASDEPEAAPSLTDISSDLQRQASTADQHHQDASSVEASAQVASVPAATEDDHDDGEDDDDDVSSGSDGTSDGDAEDESDSDDDDRVPDGYVPSGVTLRSDVGDLADLLTATRLNPNKRNH